MNANYEAFAREIADILKIRLPKFTNSPRIELPCTQLAYYDTKHDELYIKSTIVGFDGYFTIAHELRHLWQKKHESQMFHDYQTSKELDIESYNLQPAELDANAFAKEIMEEAFGVSPLFDGLSPFVKYKIIEWQNTHHLY